jgi:hypothetical protein
VEKYIKIDSVKISLISIVETIKLTTGIDIRQNCRKRELVYLKKIYYKIAKSKTNYSLLRIANFVKTKSHRMVLFHLESVDHLLETEVKYKKIYDSVLEIVKRVNDRGEVISEGDKTIYYVDKLVEVKKEVELVEKLIDYYDTKIPKHIIEHMLQYSEEELVTLYETRILPYSKMLGKVQL